MLMEIKNVRQIEREGFRRWFSDDYFDLYLWYKNDKKTLKGFQLAYGDTERHHALTWTKAHGYSHDGVDDGNIVGGYKRTPILIADGVFEPEDLIRKFRKHQGDLDDDITDFISEKIRSYPELKVSR